MRLQSRQCVIEHYPQQQGVRCLSRAVCTTGSNSRLGRLQGVVIRESLLCIFFCVVCLCSLSLHASGV